MSLKTFSRVAVALVLALGVCAGLLSGIRAAAQGAGFMTLTLEDHVAMPVLGQPYGKTANLSALSRINAIREEAPNAPRWFLPVVSGKIYIYDKKTKAFAEYLDLNGFEEARGVFKKFFTLTGYGNGLNGFILDPDYPKNGKFYTTHMEDPEAKATDLPQNTLFPNLNVSGYSTTPPIATPGPTNHQGVLVEWTDSNPSNSTFEGTAREVFRVWLNTRSHQLGEIIFNPAAKRGEPDWRALYVDVGDGGSGDTSNPAMRLNPQRLDNIVGKIIRIVPDLNEHVKTSTVSENGRYRIPNDNPFVSTPGARKEIWAYGLRNPHRLHFAIDPRNPANNRLITAICGVVSWEMITVIHKGANYGFPRREGVLFLPEGNKTGPLPADDNIPIMIDDKVTIGTVKPRYPVVVWGHDEKGGDCAGAAYLYNGKTLPALRGKLIYNDLTTGRFWYSDYKDILAADDDDPKTLAPMHEIKFEWRKTLFDTMYPIVRAAYLERGGRNDTMNGRARVAVNRADVRPALDEAGELYILSKSDGMIRRVVAASMTK